MELIIGFVMCGVVTLGVQIYLQLFATEGVRHPAFERWCAEHPLVMAVRCQPGAAIEVYEHLRRQIEPHDYFINSQGRFPWQHYAFQVEGKRTEDLVVLRLISCRHPKIRERLPNLPQSIGAFGREASSLIEEVWLQGQLHSVNRHTGIERHHLSWLGTFDSTGALQVSAMIGQPTWLAEKQTPLPVESTEPPMYGTPPFP